MDGRQSGMTLRSFKNGIHMPRRRLQGGPRLLHGGVRSWKRAPIPGRSGWSRQPVRHADALSQRRVNFTICPFIRMLY